MLTRVFTTGVTVFEPPRQGLLCGHAGGAAGETTPSFLLRNDEKKKTHARGHTHMHTRASFLVLVLRTGRNIFKSIYPPYIFLLLLLREDFNLPENAEINKEIKREKRVNRNNLETGDNRKDMREQATEKM